MGRIRVAITTEILPTMRVGAGRGQNPGVTWRGWREATEAALYGPGGFYHRPEGGPGAHFRTSSTASTYFARAVVRLLREVDESLGRPDPLDFVEVGAARGALLTAVRELAVDLRPRLRLTGVELADRPPLPEDVGWVPDVPPLTGLLIANEWLDNVPVDVVELAEDGVRLVEVAPDGEERLGPRVDAPWLDRWWPLEEEGERAEIGAPRDEAWATAVARVERGAAVAIDYGHVRGDRPPFGTLAGYREGRQIAPVPDGSCDITAHVALDAVSAATGATLTTQREALKGLGVTRTRTTDPATWQRAGEEAELIARGGLGDFGWVVQAVRVELPRSLMGR